jgi:short-subunit dehydrogenase
MAAATFTMPSRPLTWLITGTTSGFGLSLARFVQAGGHKVIASSRNPTNIPELVSEIESKGGQWIKLDVTDPNSNKVIDDLESRGTNIDVIVNNAGFSIFSPVESTTEKEVHDQMEAMYFGPLRLIKALIPYMRKRRFGIIANISSGAALDGAPTMGPYAGAKAGLDGRLFFSRPLLIAARLLT